MVKLQKVYGLVCELIARLQGLRAKVHVDLKYGSDGTKTILELETELQNILTKIRSFTES